MTRRKGRLQLTPEMQRAMEIYKPCATGIHVCGIEEASEHFYTVLNIPARNGIEARSVFDRLRRECEIQGDEPEDFTVDLFAEAEGGMVDNFAISRQMLDRLRRLAQIDDPGGSR